MEKFENMQQNMVADDDLDQITGGRNLFNIFTTEFRGSAKKPTTLEMTLDPDEDDKTFSVSTLEMRTNPLEKQETKKTNRVVKL